MNLRLIVLQLVLAELDMDSTISSLRDRVRLQKAIYLSQEVGVRLGYRFNWYVRGPYSSALAKDYYGLHVASDGELDTEGKTLRKSVRTKLHHIKPVMSVPDDVNLDKSEWLELLSSFHYLRTTVGDEASQKLKRLKPRLSKYIPQAKRELTQVELISRPED